MVSLIFPIYQAENETEVLDTTFSLNSECNESPQFDFLLSFPKGLPLSLSSSISTVLVQIQAITPDGITELSSYVILLTAAFTNQSLLIFWSESSFPAPQHSIPGSASPDPWLPPEPRLTIHSDPITCSCRTSVFLLQLFFSARNALSAFVCLLIFFFPEHHSYNFHFF